METKSCTKDDLSGRTPQTGLLGSELSSSLKKIRFSDEEFAADTPVSNIKYYHLGFQNNNSFYLFYDQLDYRLAKYFAECKITKN